jgi:hypothetical protein
MISDIYGRLCCLKIPHKPRRRLKQDRTRLPELAMEPPRLRALLGRLGVGGTAPVRRDPIFLQLLSLSVQLVKEPSPFLRCVGTS